MTVRRWDRPWIWLVVGSALLAFAAYQLVLVATAASILVNTSQSASAGAGVTGDGVAS